MGRLGNVLSIGQSRPSNNPFLLGIHPVSESDQLPFFFRRNQNPSKHTVLCYAVPCCTHFNLANAKLSPTKVLKSHLQQALLFRLHLFRIRSNNYGRRRDCRRGRSRERSVWRFWQLAFVPFVPFVPSFGGFFSFGFVVLVEWMAG
jgi:hypothetical protein